MAKKTKISKAAKLHERLRKAEQWLKQYNGHNLLIGYIKKFNVSVGCAVAELEKLNIELTHEQIEIATQTTKETAEKNKIKKARKTNKLKSQFEERVQAVVRALEKNSISVDIDKLRSPLAKEGVSKKKREHLKKVKKWLLKYTGENLYDDYRKAFGRSPVDTYGNFNLLGLPFP